MHPQLSCFRETKNPKLKDIRSTKGLSSMNQMVVAIFYDIHLEKQKLFIDYQNS